jgi:ion channel-forming bestrophin family protein
MYTKKNYGFWMTLNWSKKPFIIGFLYASIIGLFSTYFDLNLMLPWQPIGVIGIAVAFYLGFKNNSSYDRTWEARKIYGGIVNDSRSMGVSIISFIQGENSDAIKKELIYRHIAWLTAMRHQLRLSRPWEHLENRLNGLYVPVVCEDYNNKLQKELFNYLPEEEVNELNGYSNRSTQILKKQSERFQELKDKGYFDDFRHMEFHHLIINLFDGQGKAERIKNFPFPRQYASTALWLTFVFCGLVPFGLLEMFSVNSWTMIINPFIAALIIWVFFLMEKIGDYSENPFEGTYNDVPITSISRAIEIDLREMIKDTNIPKPLENENGFLM